jgi:hypothetical protein
VYWPTSSSSDWLKDLSANEKACMMYVSANQKAVSLNLHRYKAEWAAKRAAQAEKEEAWKLKRAVGGRSKLRIHLPHSSKAAWFHPSRL